jgi:predicted PurR-regulated permease PerM
VTFPLAVALLLAAVLAPPTIALRRRGWRRGGAAGVVLVGFLLLVAGVLTLVGGQVGGQFGDVLASAEEGVEQLQTWLTDGPLGLSTAQLEEVLAELSASAPAPSELVGGALSTATAVGEVLAGTAIALFALFFFLYDGPTIWRTVLGVVPAASRPLADHAGRLGFATLVGYVRATVLVALFDATFITIGLLILDVPLAVPLGVLVFFGAFVPLVGALVTGSLAVLVALVTQGWVVALLALALIIAVQQLESHLFQPVVVGRLARVHPLAVAIAVAVGTVVAGIIGAVVAVPLVAVANSVGRAVREYQPPGPAPARDE